MAETARNIRPFSFDHRVFDDRLLVDKPQPKFTEKDLEAAKAEAFAQGKEAGITEERAGQIHKACDLLSRLLAENSRLETDLETQAERLIGDAGLLSCRILKKLMPVTTAKGGMTEIEDLIKTTLMEQHRAPRIAIHISPALQDTVQDLIERLRKDTAFEGKIAIMADEDLGESDCRMEWASGGSERLIDTIWNDINSCITKAIPQGELS